jgi:CRISPR-associated endonuclease/helicase Cas3
MHPAEPADLNLAVFWAKYGKDPQAPNGYHPLICHMIDVAMVAEQIWDRVLSPAAQRRLAAGLGLDPALAKLWISFLAGLHDTGKCSPAFALRPGAEQFAHLYANVKPNPGRGNPKDAFHGEVTALALPAYLVRRFGVPARTAKRLAIAIGGHHGTFVDLLRLQDIDGDTKAVGTGGWRTAREALAEQLGGMLGVPGAPAPTSVSDITALSLAGLVSVADWIGSDVSMFRYYATNADSAPVVGQAYLDEARGRAEQALRELRWSGWDPLPGRPTFQAMFDGRAPRPMQEAVIDLAERMAEPGLVVIEAPMGEGKTEAALYLADRFGLNMGARGLYFALPTQASSNAMFKRLRAFLEHRYPNEVINLLLLHGLADLSVDLRELRERNELIPSLTTDAGDAETAGVVAATWFTQRKRGLLARYGAGTVDQALLAALRTVHVFVRLYGLAGRVVVIDEVHAYDTYMTTLLKRLLAWLAALGSPVVLLSATLPTSRRDELVAAYCRGLLGREPQIPIPPASYPRVTWVMSRGTGGTPEVHATTVAPSRPGQRVQVLWKDGSIPARRRGPFPLGDDLQRELADGGCAAVICNTVRRAQAMYRALARYFKGKASDGLPVLDLFHARFLQGDRAAREQRALDRFGADKTKRPHRAVLVATQVIEQSLDLDFDLMVTDFAPIDLMLQRAGRLWRHAGTDRRGIAEPALWVCTPECNSEGLPQFPGGDARIYDEHVLFRTWLETQRKQLPSLTFPDDIQPLVEAVYGDDEPDDSLSSAELAHWQTTRSALLAARSAETEQAKYRWVPGPEQRVDQLAEYTRNAGAEDEPDFHPAHQAMTRNPLAPPTVQVVFLYGTTEQPTLARDGTPLSLEAKPGRERTRALLERSASLQSPYGLVMHLLHRGETPKGWQRSPHLRTARLIALDRRGRAEVGGYRIRLSRRLGVCAEKIGALEGEQA